jgi:hypothetical protein
VRSVSRYRPLMALVVSMCVSASAYALPRFNGVWRGTFHGMGTGPQPNDKVAVESAHEFELRLNETDGTISGEFHQTDSTLPTQSLRNAKRFDDRACFDVTLDDGTDMRWCVSLRHGDLVGMWSKGPEGGPALGGLGVGARLFEIKAKRVPPK